MPAMEHAAPAAHLLDKAEADLAAEPFQQNGQLETRYQLKPALARESVIETATMRKLLLGKCDSVLTA